MERTFEFYVLNKQLQKALKNPWLETSLNHSRLTNCDCICAVGSYNAPL